MVSWLLGLPGCPVEHDYRLSDTIITAMAVKRPELLRCMLSKFTTLHWNAVRTDMQYVINTLFGMSRKDTRMVEYFFEYYNDAFPPITSLVQYTLIHGMSHITEYLVHRFADTITPQYFMNQVPIIGIIFTICADGHLNSLQWMDHFLLSKYPHFFHADSIRSPMFPNPYNPEIEEWLSKHV